MSLQYVIWDRESNRLEMATIEALINFNMNRFLDDEPGRVLVRGPMDEDHARRFIRSYAALMAKRSLVKLGEAMPS